MNKLIKQKIINNLFGLKGNDLLIINNANDDCEQLINSVKQEQHYFNQMMIVPLFNAMTEQVGCSRDLIISKNQTLVNEYQYNKTQLQRFLKWQHPMYTITMRCLLVTLLSVLALLIVPFIVHNMILFNNHAFIVTGAIITFSGILSSLAYFINSCCLRKFAKKARLFYQKHQITMIDLAKADDDND